MTHENGNTDYLEVQYGKPVLLTGSSLPDQQNIATHPLEEKWADWLGRFEIGSVVYCAFETALKPPVGAATVEEALPEGFEERVRGRGVVCGGWVQQPQILAHPSVGCFVSHCGFGILSGGLNVPVEVERREEDGWFSKESVCNAVKMVMDEDSKIGNELRVNHCKLRELILLKQDFETSYIDSFINKLQDQLMII
ncbi:UDP-glucuronosyl/UDP-glucosyltransferase [Macleaya cordata]|uniref:UDP-glucuronosyl/UDP-glucosyltransferase n=1 Tax=Macleaya cordata TaxID=56857 RepID=A0A200QMI3_MACCD|nr:UDP-glucuronosyl/UDP-glucosyltransferase [Macleaya cordata]